MEKKQADQTAALVIGARGGIGNALVRKLSADREFDTVYAVTRSATSDFEAREAGKRVQWMQVSDHQAEIRPTLDAIFKDEIDIKRICIATGTLHGKLWSPEKRIEDLDAEAASSVFYINTILPMLWLGALIDVLPSASRCVVAVLSARLGSISDNKVGGWYSYRASKAALNMMVKTASIEYRRRRPGVKLIAFHPGTTNTELSRPYQSRVPSGKLFAPDFVADRLLDLMSTETGQDNFEYLDWSGKSIPF